MIFAAGHFFIKSVINFQDTDSKKWEKKEASGPPLQTASMSVRALIEEKIIQKRTTKPTATAQTGLTTYPSKEIYFCIWQMYNNNISMNFIKYNSPNVVKVFAVRSAI